MNPKLGNAEKVRGSDLRSFKRFFEPGIGLKRYLIVLILAITFIGLGLTLILLDIYRTTPDNWLLPIVQALSLQQLPRLVRVLIFGAIGIGLLAYGIYGLNKSLLQPFVRPGKPILETVSNYRKRSRGPRIVAIGGGHGLASLLRGLKFYSNNITAIVTVGDDGGSSGELRRRLGALPPGDIRACLAALSDDEELTTQLFKYRFGEEAGLNGHSLGNLLITALSDITGSFEEGIAESGRVLAVRGKVMPSTLYDVKLVADLHTPATELYVKGESNIPTTSGTVQRVWLEPANPKAYPPAVQAILGADLIVIGPGSLYTSVIPNLLVPDIAGALKASKGFRVYVCNITTQPGETDGYNAYDHVISIEKHLGSKVFNAIMCNSKVSDEVPENVEQVFANARLEEDYPVQKADLIDEIVPTRHDPIKLARALMDMFYDKTGPQFYKDDLSN